MRRSSSPWVVLGALLGCGQGAASPHPAEAPPDTPADAAVARVDEPAAPDPRRWIAGDLHLHLGPFDRREGQTLAIGDVAALARDAGLEFVVVTPHLRASTWDAPRRRARFVEAWREMAASARDADGVTIIPGLELTLYGYGHFGVSGVDLGALDGDDVLAAATAAGGFVVINHPYALPTRIPGIPISEKDLSFRPWTRGRGEVPPALDGVEVWNLPLGLANLVSRPGGETGEERAFAAADALARTGRRRVAVVGGTDSHRAYVEPTTWVLARDASEAAIVEALHAGATCVGGPAAGTLEARGDRDAGWARIGEVARAARRVDLRWRGRARLYVDGADVGEHDGGWAHDGAGGVHTYRIVAGDSRCGFVYANL